MPAVAAIAFLALVIILSIDSKVRPDLRYHPDIVERYIHLETFYYRLESYPLAWHIAKDNLLWGIGLRTPRDGYLEDYEIQTPGGSLRRPCAEI